MQENKEISDKDKSKNRSIEDVIDLIIARRKSKNFDFDRFSMKNKKGESLYFIKKGKKEEKEEKLSDEIIHEAKFNLGEKPDDSKKENIEPKNKNISHDEIASEIDKKFKRKIDKKSNNINEKKIEKTHNIKPFFKKENDKKIEVKDTKEEKILDEILNESQIKIETKKEKKSLFKKNKKTKNKEDDDKHTDFTTYEKEIELIDEEIKNNKYENKNDENDEVEETAFQFAKEHDIFKNDDLDENKKIDEKFGFDKTTEDDFKDLNDEKFLDDKINKTNVDNLDQKQEKTKEKKSFFKKKKKEKSEGKVKQNPPSSSVYDPGLKFHVENIPVAENIDDDESKLVDNKIIEETKEKEKENAPDIAKEKAFKLAEKHIKSDNSSKIDSTVIQEIVKDDIEKNSAENIDEHSFFDDIEDFEEGAGGWTPQVTDIEKKKIGLSEDISAEIESPQIELPREALQTKSITLKELGFSENEWEELDFYPLQEPFAYVEILREKETLDKRYFLVEASLNEDEQVSLNFILETLDTMHIDINKIDNDGEDKYLLKIFEDIVDDYNLKIPDNSKSKILYYLKNKALGLEKIDPVMMDPNIEDISCDGSNTPLFLYHRKYGSLKSNIEFKSEDELSAFVFKLAQKCGKHISIAEPMLDATMPDGSRIQMTLSTEVSAKGSTFTIRKFREDPFSPPDLIEFNTMSAEMVAYLWLAVEHGVNTLIAGGTASGKTTALNAISLFIPRESKIVTIEETREINLPHPNWIPGVARSGFGEVVADKMVGEIDLYDLMKAALRQRPEYILVGEIRGKEAYVLFQAMATGHATYSTVHADSAQSLIHRLEGKPINIPRVMLQSLDVVTLHIITRVKNKRARRCKQIIEIIDIDPTTKEILTNEVFRWDPVEDGFIYSGKSYVLESIRAEKDMSREDMTVELKNRTNIVDWMNKNNIREFRKVATIVSQYIENPSEVIKKIK